MGRTVIALAVVGVALAGACVSGGSEETSGSTTTTTTAEDSSTTTTTGPGGSGGGTEGETAGGNECEGEPPIWALKSVNSPDGPGVDDDDDPETSIDPVDPDVDDPGDSGDGSTGSDDESDGSGRSGDDDSTGSDDESDEPGGGSSGSDECTPVEEPELGTGDVQITLRWESDADLDLHVIEPSGEEIWYSDRGPTSTGGQLDVDSNVGCDNDGSVENVFWPEGDMPLGDYTVKVVGFSVDGCGGGEYTLTVKVQGEEILNETGSVSEDEEDVFEFST